MVTDLMTFDFVDMLFCFLIFLLAFHVVHCVIRRGVRPCW